MRFFAGLFAFALVAYANADVVPNANVASPGNGSFFLYSTTATGRTFQMIINANQLTTLVGKNLTGMQFRLRTAETAAWPPVNLTFATMNIFIGPGVTPAARSLTFASNFTGAATQVRSTPLNIAANSFTFGGSPVNAFGPAVAFDTAYPYSGGNLCVEMRFSAMSPSSTLPAFDSITTSGVGYLVDFASVWTSNISGTSGAAGNFVITNFTTPTEFSFGPSSYSVQAGLNFGGTLASLQASDNDKALILCDEFDSNAQMEFIGASPLATISTIKMTFEGNASRSDLTQFVEEFNYTTNSYVFAAIQTATLVDSVVTNVISTGAQAYFNGSSEAKARARWIPQNDITATDGWVQSCDQVKWTVF